MVCIHAITAVFAALLCLASAAPVLDACWRDDMPDQVNRVRGANGKDPLVLDDRLNGGAQKHSDYQAKIKKLAHEDACGEGIAQRCMSAGIVWTGAGENVAWNTRTVNDTATA
ncbi:hypothetical protein FBU59_005947 [Linderina macrospora]|uniref:Uncharacterized protein n=1 Tax=Linderina macrospora TaxID=4868 RepID=A0ACC1J173_9FUNG|nr:hypothetical protein FBU59_005947 [Linderina macrospora]